MKVPIVIPIGKLLINECRMEPKYFSLQKIEALFRSILRVEIDRNSVADK